MSDYHHPLYLTEVEAEELLGVVAAYASDEGGREQQHGLDYVLGQLYGILGEEPPRPCECGRRDCLAGESHCLFCEWEVYGPEREYLDGRG
jgi:hypothetical protein